MRTKAPEVREGWDQVGESSGSRDQAGNHDCKSQSSRDQVSELSGSQNEIGDHDYKSESSW